MNFNIIHGNALDVLRTLPSESVHCCITSPPYYGLRDYRTGRWTGGDPSCSHTNHHGEQGHNGERADRAFTGAQNFYRDQCAQCGAVRVDQQIGLERTPEEYVARLVEVFAEVRRVLRSEGTLWLNIGDCYATGAGKVGDCPGGGEQGNRWAGRHPGRMKQGGLDTNSGAALGPITQPNRMPLPGLKPKDLIGIPWRLAFALQADGWWLRQDIIWCKGNGMPESVRDRCTRAHEYVFMFSKSCSRLLWRHKRSREWSWAEPKPHFSRRFDKNGDPVWFNLWQGFNYFFDGDAISEPTSEVSLARYARKRSDHHKYRDGGPGGQTIARTFDHMKQDGHGRRHAGFNAREFAGDPRERRNKRSWWVLNTQPTPEAHFATFPLELPETCLLAGCPEGGVVLDPFAGAGTTGLACLKNGRHFIGIELNAQYIAMANARARKYYPLLMEGIQA